MDPYGDLENALERSLGDLEFDTEIFASLSSLNLRGWTPFAKLEGGMLNTDILKISSNV